MLDRLNAQLARLSQHPFAGVEASHLLKALDLALASLDQVEVAA